MYPDSFLHIFLHHVLPSITLYKNIATTDIYDIAFLVGLKVAALCSLCVQWIMAILLPRYRGATDLCLVNIFSVEQQQLPMNYPAFYEVIFCSSE